MPEEILPVLGFIIYIVLNVLGVVGNKKKKPNTPAPPPINREENPPRKSIFEELERQLKETTQSNPKTPPPITAETEDEPYLSPGQEHKPLVEYKPLSAEILNAPYSNLEEGILDDVHKSKFPHHRASTKRRVKKKKKNVFGKATIKDAFVASLVFERKHFDV